MASAELSANANRHGYIDKQTAVPPVYFADLPDIYAKTGAIAVGEHYRRGFIVFNVSGLGLGDAVITEARLIMTNIMSSGTATPWEISFYTGGTLDLDDLPGSWDTGEYAFVVEGLGGTPPTSVDETLRTDLLGRIVNADDEIVFRLKLGAFSGTDPMWKPEARYATLHIAYSTGGVSQSLESDLTNEVTLRSSLADSEALESALANEVELKG